ncbi:MAG: hypothetical protein KAT77_05025 [Nanoarchaeota archaeon]|nr:hypothetical protein [Nanoarchaeota archaeon]
MATFLDVGLLNYFSIIFPALLVFAVVFALLTTTKVLGTNKSINAIIAVVLGFMVLLSEDIVKVINFMAPWFVLIFIFVVLLVLVYRTAGATEKDMTEFIRTDRSVKWAIFAVGVIIFLAALGTVLGQNIGPYLQENATIEEIQSGVATGSWEQNITATLFHPKILGVIMVLVIAVFTIALLGMKPDY